MSIIFRYFKCYKIVKTIEDIPFCCQGELKIKYLNGDSTSHSCGNITKVQDLIELYHGERIPYINEDYIQSENDKLDLIEPLKMSKVFTEILKGSEVDTIDIRDRIEWMKELSDDGYYIAYD